LFVKRDIDGEREKKERETCMRKEKEREGGEKSVDRYSEFQEFRS
jgi:hypothetical protein